MMLVVWGGTVLASYTPTTNLANKIDTVADAIMDLLVKKSESYGESVITLLSDYEKKFAEAGNERNQYIAWRLLLQIEQFHTCTTAGGTWLTVVNECEYVDQARCDDAGGTFNECGSACRHEGEEVICTKQCVPYCDVELAYEMAETTSWSMSE